MYASFVDELIAYFKTRFRPAAFIFLAAFLCAAAATVPPSFPWRNAAVAMLPALLLLLQFRVWDDLADRQRDAVTHADRVLVTSGSVTSYQWLVIVTAATNILIAATFAMLLHAMVFVALNILLLAWYGWLRDYLRHPLLHSHVVLLKYPVFVWVLNGIIGAKPSRYLGYLMLLTYFAFCVYEMLHDPILQRLRMSFVLRAAESAILAAGPLALLAWPAGNAGVDEPVLYLVSALTALILGLAMVVHRHRPVCKGTHLAPVCVAVLQLVMLNIRSSQ